MYVNPSDPNRDPETETDATGGEVAGEDTGTLSPWLANVIDSVTRAAAQVNDPDFDPESIGTVTTTDDGGEGDSDGGGGGSGIRSMLSDLPPAAIGAAALVALLLFTR